MLRVYAFFHCNLMFSSIEENARGTVIDRCYFPILRLAERLQKPIGIEATGYTLEEIARLRPDWIAECRRLMERGLIELIGSGTAQIIGPLMPAALVQRNLEIGNETYERLLGARPALALVNEQAYSAGILAHYERAGLRAIFMDWDMCAHAHPDWPDEWRYHPQHARGIGARLPVLWTSTLAFQKLQRLAHGDIDLDDYLAFVRARAGGEPRTLTLYSNDAEVVDFRPGRYSAEAVPAGTSEWEIVARAFESVVTEPGVQWIAPSAALADRSPHAYHTLDIQSAAFPVPVKKHLKYNVSRWAVTGRADFELNRRCRALARRLSGIDCQDTELWRRLCWLASSDFRTHITETRFAACLAELDRLESHVQRVLAPSPRATAPAQSARGPTAPGYIRNAPGKCPIEIDLPSVQVRLNPRKGLAIETLHFKSQSAAIIGTVKHGTYDDLVHAFDWFSGTLIAEFVGRAKVTDLAVVTASIETEHDGTLIVSADIATPLGMITKSVRIDAAAPSVSVHYRLAWSAAESGTLRIGNITLLPEAVDPLTLYFATHNGGDAPERFPLKGETIDHSAPVSFLVSASSGVGMTEGSIVIGDAKNAIRISACDDSDAFLGLVTHRMVKDKVFCRVALSAAELDETRKPWLGAAREIRLGYTLSPA